MKFYDCFLDSIMRGLFILFVNYLVVYLGIFIFCGFMGLFGFFYLVRFNMYICDYRKDGMRRSRGININLFNYCWRII